MTSATVDVEHDAAGSASNDVVRDYWATDGTPNNSEFWE